MLRSNIFFNIAGEINHELDRIEQNSDEQKMKEGHHALNQLLGLLKNLRQNVSILLYVICFDDLKVYKHFQSEMVIYLGICLMCFWLFTCHIFNSKSKTQAITQKDKYVLNIDLWKQYLVSKSTNLLAPTLKARVGGQICVV